MSESEDNKPKEEMISMEGAKLIEDKSATSFWTGKPIKPTPRTKPINPRRYNNDKRQWEGGDIGPLFDFDFDLPNWAKDVLFLFCIPVGMILFFILLAWFASLK